MPLISIVDNLFSTCTVPGYMTNTCCWISAEGKALLAHPYLSVGDRCAIVGQHGCRADARWTVSDVPVEDDNNITTMGFSRVCSKHLSDEVGDRDVNIHRLGATHSEDAPTDRLKDRERVRVVTQAIVLEVLKTTTGECRKDTIANRVADALASSSPALVFRAWS